VLRGGMVWRRGAFVVSVVISGVLGCAASRAVCPSPTDEAMKSAAPLPEPVPRPEVTLQTEDDKTLYALGRTQGSSMAAFELTARELEIVEAGMADQLLKRPPRVKMDDYGPKVDALAKARGAARVATEVARGKAYCKEAVLAPGARLLPSGVVMRTETAGTGSSPGPTYQVTVQYEGKLIDGTLFDSSSKHDGPATLPLAGVIACWTAGLGQMKAGEKAVLVCPPDTAYGNDGRPPNIPGGATLVFEVELLSFAPHPEPEPALPSP
jgi:FKBP-type peptidyl-prolyl cis-trans isomerase FkpA